MQRPYQATPEQIRAAKPPTPVTGLVERVAGTIINGVACDHIEERTARTLLLVIADEVERRGDQGLDLDPGETSDWLRREAQSTSQED